MADRDDDQDNSSKAKKNKTLWNVNLNHLTTKQRLPKSQVQPRNIYSATSFPKRNATNPGNTGKSDHQTVEESTLPSFHSMLSQWESFKRNTKSFGPAPKRRPFVAPTHKYSYPVRENEFPEVETRRKTGRGQSFAVERAKLEQHFQMVKGKHQSPSGYKANKQIAKEASQKVDDNNNMQNQSVEKEDQTITGQIFENLNRVRSQFESSIDSNVLTRGLSAAKQVLENSNSNTPSEASEFQKKGRSTSVDPLEDIMPTQENPFTNEELEKVSSQPFSQPQNVASSDASVVEGQTKTIDNLSQDQNETLKEVRVKEDQSKSDESLSYEDAPLTNASNAEYQVKRNENLDESEKSRLSTDANAKNMQDSYNKSSEFPSEMLTNISEEQSNATEKLSQTQDRPMTTESTPEELQNRLEKEENKEKNGEETMIDYITACLSDLKSQYEAKPADDEHEDAEKPKPNETAQNEDHQKHLTCPCVDLSLVKAYPLMPNAGIEAENLLTSEGDRTKQEDKFHMAPTSPFSSTESVPMPKAKTPAQQWKIGESSEKQVEGQKNHLQSERETTTVRITVAEMKSRFESKKDRNLAIQKLMAAKKTSEKSTVETTKKKNGVSQRLPVAGKMIEKPTCNRLTQSAQFRRKQESCVDPSVVSLPAETIRSSEPVLDSMVGDESVNDRLQRYQSLTERSRSRQKSAERRRFGMKGSAPVVRSRSVSREDRRNKVKSEVIRSSQADDKEQSHCETSVDLDEVKAFFESAESRRYLSNRKRYGSGYSGSRSASRSTSRGRSTNRNSRASSRFTTPSPGPRSKSPLTRETFRFKPPSSATSSEMSDIVKPPPAGTKETADYVPSVQLSSLKNMFEKPGPAPKSPKSPKSADIPRRRQLNSWTSENEENNSSEKRVIREGSMEEVEGIVRPPTAGTKELPDYNLSSDFLKSRAALFNSPPPKSYRPRNKVNVQNNNTPPTEVINSQEGSSDLDYELSASLENTKKMFENGQAVLPQKRTPTKTRYTTGPYPSGEVVRPPPAGTRDESDIVPATNLSSAKSMFENNPTKTEGQGDRKEPIDLRKEVMEVEQREKETIRKNDNDVLDNARNTISEESPVDEPFSETMQKEEYADAETGAHQAEGNEDFDGQKQQLQEQEENENKLESLEIDENQTPEE